MHEVVRREVDTITRRKFIQMTGAGAIAAAAHTLF
ncbi:MAG: twin-arginine translocation signal domain-containing protein, partial [Actinomycetota bacterium]